MSLGSFETLEPRNLLAVGAIELGPQTGFYDQPYVDVELRDGNHGLGPYGSVYGLDLYMYNHFLLDTGANAILAAAEATGAMASRGYRTEGEFRELGVAGYTDYDVSAPYRLEFRGTDDVQHAIPQTDDAVRILSSADSYLGASVAMGGVAGVVGMPAMVHRVTTLDLSGWAEDSDLLDIEPLEVRFSQGPDALPPDAGHRYSVAVDDRISFDAADGLPPGSPPDAPLPAWAPVPLMTAIAEYQGVAQPGNFLFDTGAQMSMISPSLAFALGLDEDGDGNFENEKTGTVPIGGVGGTMNVPTLLIDKLRLPTEEGVELVWLDDQPGGGLEVLVLDVHEGIDGVFGVDLLTSGLTFDLDPVTWEFTLDGVPYFRQVHLDFREMLDGSGTIYFDLNPVYDEIELMPGVVGRYVFYNNSSFDGNDPAANALDDLAIATDKRALLPGQTACFDNYTSFHRGINGVMLDIHDLPEGAVLSNADFEFRVGNDDDPAGWSPVDAVAEIAVRENAGLGGSDRVTITWPDYSIRDQWLSVTVRASANTGLSEEDVFYFGNAVGEAGNSHDDAQVDVIDLLLARNNPRGLLDPAPIDFGCDYDRDGRVNATDVLLARNHQTDFISALDLIGVPSRAAEPEPAAEGIAPTESAEPLDATRLPVDLWFAGEIHESFARHRFQRHQENPVMARPEIPVIVEGVGPLWGTLG